MSMERVMCCAPATAPLWGAMSSLTSTSQSVSVCMAFSEPGTLKYQMLEIELHHRENERGANSEQEHPVSGLQRAQHLPMWLQYHSRGAPRCHRIDGVE